MDDKLVEVLEAADKATERKPRPSEKSYMPLMATALVDRGLRLLPVVPGQTVYVLEGIYEKKWLSEWIVTEVCLARAGSMNNGYFKAVRKYETPFCFQQKVFIFLSIGSAVFLSREAAMTVNRNGPGMFQFELLQELLEAAYEYARTESTKEECFFDYVAKYLRNDERVRLLPITPYDRVWTTNKKQKWSVVEVSITSEGTTFVAIQQGQDGEIRRKVFNVANLNKSVFAERLCGN